MISAATRRVPLASIVEPDHQLRTRIDPERLGELADSMSAEGLHQPIGLRGPDADELYEIVWGHRRYLAARLLGWDDIEAKVFSRDFDPLLAAVNENLQREQLTPLEEAHAVQRFVGRGLPRVEIARRFRRSLAWVHQRIALLELPEDLREAIDQYGLQLSVAAQLADVDHEPYRRQLIAEALRDGATASTAAVWRQHYLADRERIRTNSLRVEQVIQERDKYVLRYPCDWCDDQVEYKDTRTIRLCVPCHDDLLGAKSRAVSPVDKGA